MTPLTPPRENKVHFPVDRRPGLWIRPTLLIGLTMLVALPIIIAWIQYGFFGLPAVANPVRAFPGSSGFPLWLRTAHYISFVLMLLLIRSGLSILADHPRLYRHQDCTPNSEWIRFTPLAVPTDRIWTAKDDARYISPLWSLPGYRHTVGVARHWHFLSVLFWVLTGVIYVALLFAQGHWARLVPTYWGILPDAWRIFVHYATFHLPPEPDGFYAYQALQQLAYFAVVFVMAPLSILSGLAMSPALDGRFAWYPRLFDGRQGARSLHFLLMVGFSVFLMIHVALVLTTGVVRNMNHIVMGTDTGGPAGWMLGTVGIIVALALLFAAYWVSWHHPRALQLAAHRSVGTLTLRTLDPLTPKSEFSTADISPHFWSNGKLPTSQEWQTLLSEDFEGFKLRVSGLVNHPVELSLGEIMALGQHHQITLHHCIQGWSGVAEWGGLPMSALIDLVQPQPEARVVVFHSFGEGLYGGEYYETLSMKDARHPQCLLAYEMNGEQLGANHGAPLRLRAENQLGYKMIKWISSVEFVASEKEVGQGFGGANEDHEYFDLVPNI
ncbi:molybdopterin-dependent oxidoreductase [Deinococcus detaillensis]|uniref:Molybdopterin-dependent oxidoreductase n=1 Tax=Deinococcus detaillensis TaxID=2592048 RepID=A0A553UHK4_9DEIO|nr:molybdopterin-dependent oxidoreductase [Deinococcus detaillensis]TSA79511.1 molybdopterin-dependent oxidoreductase [Deinococcus detaillensis]